MSAPNSLADPWKRIDEVRRNITSQHGEDGIIEHLLKLAPDIPKTCLEVGAYDGITMSNTHHLWADLGWRALLIEASTGLFDKLSKITAGYTNVTAIKAFLAASGDHSIESIAKRCNFPMRIGVVSLDIDSNELEVFENFGSCVADIVVMEFNHEIPVHVVYRDLPGDVFFRHSAKAVEIAGRKLGYRIVACCGPNAILIRESSFHADALKQLPDLPVEAMFDHSFVRGRRAQRRFVESKFVTERLAVYNKPNTEVAWMAFIFTAGRRWRRWLRGQSAGANVTEARRENLKRAGLWI